jgi:hypothetical protein
VVLSSAAMRLRFLALALFAVAGCPGAATQVGSAPRAGVTAWAKVAGGDQPREAYDMLASSVRKQVSFEAFEKKWKETGPERKRQAAALAAAAATSDAQGENGRIVLADGKTVPLVREGGSWRLEVPLLPSSDASSPQEALRQLAAAMDARNVDGVLRLLTADRQKKLRDTLNNFVENLKQNAGNAVEVVGDRAFLSWNDGKDRWKITLKREDGEWRIDDITEVP